MLTPIMSLHLATVAPAAVLGAYLMLRSKGTPLHRLLGKILHGTDDDYGAAFFAYSCRGRPSGFGSLRSDSLAVVARAVFCAQRLHRSEKHNVTAHKGNMIGVYVGGILVAGLFTLTPGRYLHQLLFANQTSELCLYSALSRIRQKDPRHDTTAL